eukprot:5969505-Pyramimonas_sp.AAC.1
MPLHSCATAPASPSRVAEAETQAETLEANADAQAKSPDVETRLVEHPNLAGGAAAIVGSARQIGGAIAQLPEPAQRNA